jgi:dienelactone hydrolase
MSRRSSSLTRRDLLRTTGVYGLGASSLGFSLGDPLPAAAAPAIEPWNRFPRMVQEYFVDRVRGIEQHSLERKDRLNNKAEAEAYVREVRAKIRQAFGPMPERTPLKPRITGVVERDTYKIEKLIFESRPGFLVTANLYLPKGRSGRLPGVVGTCGHSVNGKAAEAYQSFAQGLTRMGYVVLLYDPIGQGERLQYTDADLKPRVGVGTREHLYAGNQQFLVGEFVGTWRAWDGIRALDYLLTREEVDPKHVGVTGNSGGGTMTTWLCGVEQRWTMAAPSCFVTTFRRNLENELPADTEQCPPRAIGLGLDHDDFIAAVAPKPVILLAKEKDYFDARGNLEAYLRLKRLYKLLGAEENVAQFFGPTYHGYSQENREAMYRWFNGVTKVSNAQTEPELQMEEDETLQCTPKGQVAGMQSRTVYSFTKAKSQTIAKGRKRLRGTSLAAAVRDALKMPEERGVPDFRILRTRRQRDYPTPYSISYAVDTEPGVHALVYRLSDEPLHSRPPLGGKRAVLYVSHHSADAELREEPLLKELVAAEKDSAFFTCDVRGIGDSRPDTCGIDSFLQPYGSDYFYAIHSIMLDYPYAGQKTYDLLRVIDWLGSSGHTEVHLVAKGWGAIPGTFAALLSDAVVQVTLKNALTSYTDVAESEEYSWPLSAFVPDALRTFDLPDCYRDLEGKKLRRIEPWGASAFGA